MPGFLAKLDRFTIGLIVSVGAGILVPCSGVWDTVFSRLSDAANTPTAVAEPPEISYTRIPMAVTCNHIPIRAEACPDQNICRFRT